MIERETGTNLKPIGIIAVVINGFGMVFLGSQESRQDPRAARNVLIVLARGSGIDRICREFGDDRTIGDLGESDWNPTGAVILGQGGGGDAGIGVTGRESRETEVGASGGRVGDGDIDDGGSALERAGIGHLEETQGFIEVIQVSETGGIP